MDHFTIIPEPKFLGPSTGHAFMVARFRCPLDCGWWHDEPTDPNPGPTRLPLRSDGSIDWESHGLVLEAQGELLRAGVEHALTEHYRQHHPEH